MQEWTVKKAELGFTGSEGTTGVSRRKLQRHVKERLEILVGLRAANFDQLLLLGGKNGAPSLKCLWSMKRSESSCSPERSTRVHSRSSLRFPENKPKVPPKPAGTSGEPSCSSRCKGSRTVHSADETPQIGETARELTLMRSQCKIKPRGVWCNSEMKKLGGNRKTRLTAFFFGEQLQNKKVGNKSHFMIQRPKCRADAAADEQRRPGSRPEDPHSEKVCPTKAKERGRSLKAGGSVFSSADDVIRLKPTTRENPCSPALTFPPLWKWKRGGGVLWSGWMSSAVPLFGAGGVPLWSEQLTQRSAFSFAFSWSFRRLDWSELWKHMTDGALHSGKRSVVVLIRSLRWKWTSDRPEFIKNSLPRSERQQTPDFSHKSDEAWRFWRRHCTKKRELQRREITPPAPLPIYKNIYKY